MEEKDKKIKELNDLKELLKTNLRLVGSKVKGHEKLNEIYDKEITPEVLEEIVKDFYKHEKDSLNRLLLDKEIELHKLIDDRLLYSVLMNILGSHRDLELAKTISEIQEKLWEDIMSTEKRIREISAYEAFQRQFLDCLRLRFEKIL